MSRSLSFPFLLLTAIFCFVAPFGASAQNAVCSLDSVEVDPASVIAPCSAIIGQKNISDAERGYALWIRGKGYHSTKRFDLAGTDYDEALRLTPDNEELMISRANVAFNGGRVKEALALLKQALKVNPRSASALHTVGWYYRKVGDGDQAVNFFSQALVTDRTDPYALLWRGQIYIRRQQFNLALKDFEILVGMPPEAINRHSLMDGEGNRLDFHITVLANRAEIFRKTGRLDLAEQDLDRAVNYKRTADSLSARGEFLFYYTQAREADALRDLSEASALDPENDDTHFTLGQLHMRLKAWSRAMEEFNATLKIYPGYSEALIQRALLHRELGEIDLAVNDIERALSFGGGQTLARILPAMRNAGYWSLKDEPTAYTPALADAVRACMVDRMCN